MLLSADLVNGGFEAFASLMVLNHCRVLRSEKMVRGVSVVSCAFFMLWGMWNLYYYPSLAQPLSFYGGVLVVAANMFYVGMLVRFRREENMLIQDEPIAVNRSRVEQYDIHCNKGRDHCAAGCAVIMDRDSLARCI